VKPGGSKIPSPSEPADVLGPVAGGFGPAAVVRELARDLLRQERMTRAEATRFDAALRDHDWPAVRSVVDTALRRRVAPGPGQPEPTAAAAPAAPRAGPIPGGAGPAGAARETAAADAEAGAILRGLQNLVLQLCDAVAQLADDEGDGFEQLAPIRALVCGRLSRERLDEAGARIAALVERQANVRRSIQEAHSSLKDMLTLLVERLGAVGISTERFQQQVSAYRNELVGTPSAEVLARVASGLMADTRAVADAIRDSQNELAEARRKVESYELRVRSLENQLERTARMMQNDALTQTLNRRGLDEVFRLETARAARYGVPLTLVMIDLDDFKAINDSLGHAAGDRALVHFVTTANASLRSTERVARTGGEEFVIVFPATGIADAFEAMRRMQRDLARSPFPYEGQLRAVTFSAGAAEWRAGESLAQTMRRADVALYRAKHRGKDRVEIAA
jgi:diguanylate cyclase